MIARRGDQLGVPSSAQAPRPPQAAAADWRPARAPGLTGTETAQPGYSAAAGGGVGLPEEVREIIDFLREIRDLLRRQAGDKERSVEFRPLGPAPAAHAFSPPELPPRTVGRASAGHPIPTLAAIARMLAD